MLFLQQKKHILFGAILLLVAAYINGFPIVYSDTSTYLASGFELETPIDRPIAYGLFLRASSLNGVSLWLTIGVQALIISFLLWTSMQLLLKNKPRSSKIQFFFFSLLVLISSTSLSWVTSELIADIMTPILILSVLLLLLGKPSTLEKMALYSLFFLATSCHLSHVTFNLILLTLIGLFYALNMLGAKAHMTLKPFFLLLALTFGSFLTMGSAFSKSKHVFFMGALVEHGIAKTYLDEYCPEHDYKLCAYKEQLPSKGYDFLWNPQSPFYKIGGWENTKEEFDSIIFTTLTTPKYIFIHIQASLKATLEQLLQFGIGDGNGVFLKQTLLYQRVGTYFGLSQQAQYAKSLQNKNKLSLLNSYNDFLQCIIGLSFLAALFILFNYKKYKPTILIFFVLLMLALILNAWSCGTFANALDRLGAKVIWLLPFGVLLVAFSRQKTTADPSCDTI